VSPSVDVAREREAYSGAYAARMPEKAVEVVREVFARWERGEEAFDLLARDVEWEVVPDLFVGDGRFYGRDGVREFMRQWLGAWRDYRIQLLELEEAGEGRALSVFREHARGRGSGAEVELTVAALWPVRDGVVARYRSFATREDALGAVERS